MLFASIKKRHGEIVAFDASKVTAAIAKAGKATGQFDEREARRLTGRTPPVFYRRRALRLRRHLPICRP